MEDEAIAEAGEQDMAHQMPQTVPQAEEPAPARGIGRRAWGLLVRELPYIGMLVLAVFGATFRMPFNYWVILTPVFALISIISGWRHFHGKEGHLSMVISLAFSWLGIILAIFILFDSAVQAATAENAQSLVMMTLVALGVFISGVQARLWRMCLVGGLLFAAVPALGWLDRIILAVATAFVAIMVAGGVAWWADRPAKAAV
jgi:hypothetical protein